MTTLAVPPPVVDPFTLAPPAPAPYADYTTSEFRGHVLASLDNPAAWQALTDPAVRQRTVAALDHLATLLAAGLARARPEFARRIRVQLAAVKRRQLQVTERRSPHARND